MAPPSFDTSSRASLPLQVALYFHGFYAAAFVVVELICFAFKGVSLPYPQAALGLEVAFVFLFALMEWGRLSLASTGNRLEAASQLLASLALAAPVVVFHVYYMRLQTYVLRLELVINAIALAFTSLEALLTAFGVSRLWQARRY